MSHCAQPHFTFTAWLRRSGSQGQETDLSKCPWDSVSQDLGPHIEDLWAMRCGPTCCGLRGYRTVLPTLILNIFHGDNPNVRHHTSFLVYQRPSDQNRKPSSCLFWLLCFLQIIRIFFSLSNSLMTMRTPNGIVLHWYSFFQNSLFCLAFESSIFFFF